MTLGLLVRVPFVPVPLVLVTLVLGVASLAFTFLSGLLGTLHHAAAVAGMLHVATLLAATA